MITCAVVSTHKYENHKTGYMSDNITAHVVVIFFLFIYIRVHAANI